MNFKEDQAKSPRHLATARSGRHLGLALAIVGIGVSACSGMSSRIPMPPISRAELQAVESRTVKAPSIPQRYDAQRLGRRIADISERLAKGLSRKPYRIAMMPKAGFNAGALVDRSKVDIIVGPALALALDDDELAFVLAHEMAHVENKHTDSLGTQNALIGAVNFLGNVAAFGARVALATQGVDIGTQTTNVLGRGLGHAAGSATRGAILATGYDRDQEREADYVALQYMAAARFDLEGATGALEKIRSIQASTKKSGSSDLFSTHPNTSERIVRTGKWAEQIATQAGTNPHGTAKGSRQASSPAPTRENS